MISRGKGKKAVSQSLTSNPFRMPRAEFTNCKERRPGGRKGSLDPFFMQKTLCGRPSRTITMKRKVRARRKHLERGERPKCDWMRLCITSKWAELINELCPLITGLAGLLEEEALCWCQGRRQPMERWHVDTTVVSVLPPMAALFHSSVSSSKVLPLKKTHKKGNIEVSPLSEAIIL